MGDECKRKEFKMAMAEQEPAQGGSIIALAVGVLAVVIAMVVLWRWVARPWLRRRYLTPKFMGHFRLYPATGCWARLQPQTPEKPAKEAAPAVDDPYSGAPFDGGTSPGDVATESEYAPIVAVPDLPEEGCQSVEDVPPAMLPLTDEAGRGVVVPDTACSAELWEALGASPERRIVGVHRHSGGVTVYAPAPGVEWDRYGKVDAATEQTVAVFALPARQWWHAALA